MLLYPERGLVLNPTAAEIVKLCTGEHTVARDRGPAGRKYAPKPRGRRERGVEVSRRMAERGLSARATARERGRVRGPLHAGRRADLPLPAALRRTAPTRSSRAQARRAGYGGPGCASSAKRKSWASSSSTSPAASRCCATTSRSWSRARGARPLHQPDHQRHPAHARAAARVPRRSAWTTCRSRCRTSTRARLRSHRRAAVLRAKLEVAALGEGARAAAHAQRGAPPREPRPRRRDRRARRALGADRLELANTQYLGWALVNRARAAADARAARGARATVARAARAAAARARWRCCSSRPTTTPTSRRPAWTAGGGASSS